MIFDKQLIALRDHSTLSRQTNTVQPRATFRVRKNAVHNCGRLKKIREPNLNPRASQYFHRPLWTPKTLQTSTKQQPDKPAHRRKISQLTRIILSLHLYIRGTKPTLSLLGSHRRAENSSSGSKRIRNRSARWKQGRGGLTSKIRAEKKFSRSHAFSSHDDDSCKYTYTRARANGMYL